MNDLVERAANGKQDQAALAPAALAPAAPRGAAGRHLQYSALAGDNTKPVANRNGEREEAGPTFKNAAGLSEVSGDRQWGNTDSHISKQSGFLDAGAVRMKEEAEEASEVALSHPYAGEGPLKNGRNSGASDKTGGGRELASDGGGCCLVM